MSCEIRAQKKFSATRTSDRKYNNRLKSIASMRSITRNRWGPIRPRWGKSRKNSKVSLRIELVA